MNPENPDIKLTSLPTRFECVLFSLPTPGATLRPPAGELITRLFQEILERPLESKGLLCVVPTVPTWEEGKAKLSEVRREYDALVNRSIASPAIPDNQKESMLASRRQLADADARLWTGRPFLVHAREQKIEGVLFVTDAMQALRIVQEELKRLAFLEGSKIAGYDSVTNCLYPHFPSFSELQFDPHFFAMLKLFGIVPSSPANPP